jgi:peptide/nickel transport system substrate-binding protein
LNDKSSFSRSGANSKNISWLSLIIPKDSIEIKTALEGFSESIYIPESLKKWNLDEDYFQNRYQKSIQWIDKYNHAVISNGPFYLQSYSPESRTIELQKFSDTTYQMSSERVKEFESPAIPEISKVDLQKNYDPDRENRIDIETQNIDEILFFISNEKGDVVHTDRIFSENSGFKIDLDGIDYDSSKIYDVKIFGISNNILKPDYYETSFISGGDNLSLQNIERNYIIEEEFNIFGIGILIVIALVIIGIVFYFKKIRLDHSH